MAAEIPTPAISLGILPNLGETDFGSTAKNGFSHFIEGINAFRNKRNDHGPEGTLYYPSDYTPSLEKDRESEEWIRVQATLSSDDATQEEREAAEIRYNQIMDRYEGPHYQDPAESSTSDGNAYLFPGDAPKARRGIFGAIKNILS